MRRFLFLEKSRRTERRDAEGAEPELRRDGVRQERPASEGGPYKREVNPRGTGQVRPLQVQWLNGTD